MNVLPTPKTNAMLLCDYVITEQVTNKKSLIGVFENISAGTFPCIHHSLSVYIKLTDARGAYRFRLELIDLQNDSVVGRGEIPQEVQIASPLVTHELVFNLQGLRFAHPGDYEFRILANEKFFGHKTFSVSAMNAPEPPPPQT